MTPPLPDHHQSPLRSALRFARRSAFGPAKRPFFDQDLARIRMPEPTVSAITLLRRGRLLTVMVRFVLLMGVLYPIRGGLSSPFLLIVRVIAVEDAILGHLAHRTLGEVRGFAEDRLRAESTLRGEVVADDAEDGNGGEGNLTGHRLPRAELAHDLSHHVEVADEFGVREVHTAWCIGVHAYSISTMAGKSSCLNAFSLRVSYRTVDSARSEPICIIPCDWRWRKGQNARSSKKDSRRNIVEGACIPARSRYT